MRIHLDKIASVTRNLRLDRMVTLTESIKAEPGAVLAGRILGDKSVYNQLEDVFGRMSMLQNGDLIVGALGHRNALHGYEGVLPSSVKIGDRLNVLNLGGVLGHCVSHNPDVGPPFEIEILGQVLVYPEFQKRQGHPANIQQGALKAGGPLPACPVIFVAGTCMNSGKTAAACALVRRFRAAGLRVGGLKLTGVGLMRDILGMRDYGAEVALDFTDAGVVTTNAENAAAAAKVLFSEAASRGVDVIVAETGDGIMGEYGVQAIFADPELRPLSTAFVLCANDPVGVAGGVKFLNESFGISVDLIAGPATDNRVGVRFVEQVLGLPARNARNDAQGLGDFILDLVESRKAGRA
ncbi:MAG: hypothetical protein IPP78_14375 [Holophagaceae bacterium]|nr:hypothetical protein [Holophagaceae bacterium]